MKQQRVSTERSSVSMYAFLGIDEFSLYGTISVENFPLISIFLLTLAAIFAIAAYGELNAEKAVKKTAADIKHFEAKIDQLLNLAERSNDNKLGENYTTK